METTLINNLITQITSLNYIDSKLSDITIFKTQLSLLHKPTIITVTGTNGKGTTVSILESFFKKNNLSVVSNTSPHLNYFNERIRFNSSNISNIELINHLKFILLACDTLKLKLNYYYIAFLCSCIHMNYKKPDYFILEVGIGGRLDPANTFDADIAIVTNVSLDHTEILGNTINDIYFEKAHIARKDKPIILGQKPSPKALKYITTINATIHMAKYSPKLNKSPLPTSSLACALKAVEIIRTKVGCKYDIDISRISVPGRMDIIQNNPKIIADVAHNIDGIKYLFNNVQQDIKDKRLIVIFAAQAIKNTYQYIYSLINHIDLLLLPALNHIDDRFNDINGYELKNHPEKSVVFSNFKQAYEYLDDIILAEDIVIALGSFTLIAELKKYNENKKISC